MRFLFICGSLDPGRDGVGDYTRLLAVEMSKTGHVGKVIALRDKTVDHVTIEDQVAAEATVPTVRIPVHASAQTRWAVAAAEASSVRYDWISLQFVPYSFHDRGLPFGLANEVAALRGSARVHIMFHELWVTGKGESVKEKVTGRIQSTIIRRLIRRLRPEVITTQLPLYAARLAPHPVAVLPLFGNISVTPISTPAPELHRETLEVISFGSVPSPAEFAELSTRVRAIAADHGKAIRFRFLGHGGKHKAAVLPMAQAAFGEERVTDTGPLSEAELSVAFRRADLGLAKNSGVILGKSGSAIAMLEHGLPVMVAGSRPASPSVAPYFADRILYAAETNERPLPSRATPESSVARVAERFANLLTRGSAEAPPVRLAIGTPVFPPLVGGMETMAVNLATHFTNRGIDVHVVTRTPSDKPDDYPFRVSRGLSKREIQRAVAECDLVLSNGAGLYISPHAVLAGKPLIFRHTNYQVTSVEGAGFIYGKPSPLHPYRSILFHLRDRRSLRRVLRDGPKMLLTRFFAKHFVAANVAISDWMAMRQDLPRQVRIHNPFPITRFEGLRDGGDGTHDYDLVYLGRLTAEKGVDTLLRAIAHLHPRRPVRAVVIGDGAFRQNLEHLARDLGIAEAVTFTGSLTGDKLLSTIAEARVAVVPSFWEEPFGGVTTELLASGKPMVVSERGALAEIVGAAGVTFPNGDDAALAEAIERVLDEPGLAEGLQDANSAEVARFDETDLIDQYMALFRMVLAGDPIRQSGLDRRIAGDGITENEDA